ncbi:hypothetical protein CYY_007066 [Polysphondylium violaceum]|uniref:phosphomevalonate kinase n=1 Tax=Polysphondylium violaceum TaxID=133409 RepID=A0A8J4PQ80_9MYCE|nr:hypothetical protein CYY_007066 [Polysphondylium violaceum]
MSKSICCSAPGKVLVTGGYLVLDRLYDGIVFTIDSRFYTSIVSSPLLNNNNNKSNDDSVFICDIVVHSPQFKSSQSYHLFNNPNNENKLYQLIPFGNANYRENKYVENAIIYSLILASGYKDLQSSIGSLKLDITIQGDNGFYSQIPQLKERNLPISFESLKSLPKCLPVVGTLQELQKTGLGSSAALVSSLTGALLSFLGVIDLNNSNNNNLKDKTLLHNLAQVAHCVAQGKVGSGFDISSAIFGSQVYRRFSPEIISNILKLSDKQLYPSAKELIENVNFENSKWDNQHSDMALPPGLSLLLADVSIGSNTPSMVKSILEWRKNQHSTALDLWTKLNEKNTDVKKHFTQLHALYRQDAGKYNRELLACATVDPVQWSGMNSVGTVLHSVRESFVAIRGLMREMGGLADVPLEPVEQTRLADATMSIKGCVAAGVPGAGGFDALFAIIIDSNADSSVSQQVKQTWMSWKECQVLPLVLCENSSGILVEPAENAPSSKY